MSEGDELSAARRTIAALVERQERQNASLRLEQFALHKAMANLESVLEQRTRDLLASEARHRALFDHSPDMLFAVDARGTISAANQTSAVAFGCPTGELVGRPLSTLFDPEGARRVAALVDAGPAARSEAELRLADGRRVALIIAPVPGFEGSWQVVLRDVTARRALEAELAHTRRLAAIGHLAAGVAHEVNNPLAVIQGRLEMLEIGAEPVSPPVRRVLDVIGEHVQRIARIVRNLQTFARRGGVERLAFELRAAIVSARELAGSRVRDVAFDVDVMPSDLAVLGDRVQIEQVLANLFTNAGDAMQGSGQLFVRGRLRGDTAELLVEDSGPGVPPALLDDLFTPFVTGKPPSQGTGLGLAIAWGIVQEHGGTVRVENRPGGGALFTLALPAAPPGEHAPTRPGAPQAAASRSLRVLCVEDEPSLLTTVVSLVDAAGHRAAAVSSAEEALARLSMGERFDVLLTDIRLPGMSGLALRLAAARHDPELALRTVVMSGTFHPPDPGFVYVQKPFTRGELLRALELASEAYFK